MENDRDVKFRCWSEIVPGDLLIYMRRSSAAHTYLIISREENMHVDEGDDERFNFVLLSQNGQIIDYTGMYHRTFTVVKLNKSNDGK